MSGKSSSLAYLDPKETFIISCTPKQLSIKGFRKNYKKYNIKTLEQCFIGVFILKSRFGASDMMIPTGFYGDCSHYADLPKPENIYDYEKYTSPNWLLEDEVQQLNAELNNVDETKEIDNNSNLSFIL